MKIADKIINEKPGMMRRYKKAYRNLDDLFRLMGEKGMYFILKEYYPHLDTMYKPDFNI